MVPAEKAATCFETTLNVFHGACLAVKSNSVQCRAGAESRRIQEEAAAAAEKVRQEDALIEQADKIYERRNAKQLPAFPEPKRSKVHWDHVLEEMNWMAKEFSKYIF